MAAPTPVSAYLHSATMVKAAQYWARIATSELTELARPRTVYCIPNTIAAPIAMRSAAFETKHVAEVMMAVLRVKQSAPLQLRHHQVDEIVDAAGQRRRHVVGGRPFGGRRAPAHG